MSTEDRGGPKRPERPARQHAGSPGTQARRRREAARMAQQRRQATQRRIVQAGVVIALVVLIAVVIAVVQHGTSTSAPPTPTPQPTATAVPTAAPGPTLAPGPSPAAAEVAASKTACTPFLAAGVSPTGKGQWGAAPKVVIDAAKHYQVKLYTQMGVITADILPKLAPITANNFIFLACNHYYDNVIFHRVIPGFMIQGGDPTGTGGGGPGYTIADERVARAYQIGDLAMANTGQPNSGGSQFFIMQGPQAVQLPKTYSLFGHVTAGQSVVDAIAKAPTHASSSGENSAPNQPVHIQAITMQVS